jgi:hypothetical protein
MNGTRFEQKSFTVPASSSKAPENCRHGWIDAHGKCVLCGTRTVDKGPVYVLDDRRAVEADRERDREWKPSPIFPGYEYRDIPNGRMHRATRLAKP